MPSIGVVLEVLPNQTSVTYRSVKPMNHASDARLGYRLARGSEPRVRYPPRPTPHHLCEHTPHLLGVLSLKTGSCDRSNRV